MERWNKYDEGTMQGPKLHLIGSECHPLAGMGVTYNGQREIVTRISVLRPQRGLLTTSTGRMWRVRSIDVPPPMTTNIMRPSAQMLIGLRFAKMSLRDGFTGFFPARTAFANLAFRWRISNSVGSNLDSA
jgi:hypothetical protein